MANFTALAAARHRVLADAGWDVEARRPATARRRVRVIVGEERHATIDVALALPRASATRRAERVAVDEQGRMRADALRATLAAARRGPTIVCAQAGNVNTGAFDPLDEICDAAHEHGAWVHVDGAFGLWAAVTDDRASSLAGVERADSWATDAHKWLNVPYDCGIVDLPRRRRAPRRDDDAGELPGAGRRRRAARPVRLGAGVLAPRPRHPGVRRHPRARAAKGIAERISQQLRDGARASPSGSRPSPTSRSSTTSCSTRCSSASATPTTARARSSTACSATAPAGSAAPCGTASPRCASPCRTGPRPKPTSMLPSTRSIAANLRVAKGV